MCRGLFVVGLFLLVVDIQANNQIPDSLNLNSVPPPSQQQDTRFPRDVLSSRPSDTANPLMLNDSTARGMQNDTILPDEKASADTLVPKLIRDTVRVVVRDTVVITRRDTITQYRMDVLMPRPRTKLDSAINFVQQNAVADTTARLKDTTRKMFQRFLYYARSHPVDSTINYMKKQLQADTLRQFYQDTSLQAVSDSLNRYLDYIWNKTYQDSINFTVYNKARDSVQIWLTDSPSDSSRFLIYDDKEYPAGIWIQPRNKKSLRLSFVENIRIEEVKTQQTLREILPIRMEDLGLQEQDQINMVFPQWDIDGVGKAHFNQGYLSNWARGGESSLSTLWTVRYSADYKKGKTIWDNDLEYKIGLLKSGDKSLRKNEDKLEINSKFGTNAFKNWYYSSLLNFQTQFFTGYDYPDTKNPISGFLAPSYLVFSVGMDYKPSDKLTLLLSPISSKFTMMRDTTKFDQTNFGISKNRKSKKELGAYVKSIFTIDITEKINMENKVNLFINYLGKREAIDVDYELTLNMEINRLINTTINAHLVYDRDVDPNIQFKENLSVGMQYKF